MNTLLLVLISMAVTPVPQSFDAVDVGGGYGNTGVSITSDGQIKANGKIIAPISTTLSPSMNIPHGTAPTSSTSGDFWSTTAGLFMNVDNSVVGPYISAAGVPWASPAADLGSTNPRAATVTTLTVTGIASFPASSTALNRGSINIAPTSITTAPSSSTVGDMWMNVTGLYYKYAGGVVGPLLTSASVDWANPSAALGTGTPKAATVTTLTVNANGIASFPASSTVLNRGSINMGVSSGLPSSVVDGDMWVRSTGLYTKYNSAVHRMVTDNDSPTFGTVTTGVGGTAIGTSKSDLVHGSEYISYNLFQNPSAAVQSGNSIMFISPKAAVGSTGVEEIRMLGVNSLGLGTSYFYIDEPTTWSHKFSVNAKTGDTTVAGKLSLPASTTTQAGLKTPAGSAPASPADGDIWITSAGMYFRIGSTTYKVTAVAQ